MMYFFPNKLKLIVEQGMVSWLGMWDTNGHVNLQFSVSVVIMAAMHGQYWGVYLQ